MYDEAIDVMNRLIQLDRDAIRAYAEAIEACEIFEIRSKLTTFMADHERHVRGLEQKVLSLGGEPPERRDLKGFLIEGFTALVSQGDRSALSSMRLNEELTNRMYRAALGARLPDDVRELIERNYEDEIRHLAWIRGTIEQRAWNTERAA